FMPGSRQMPFRRNGTGPYFVLLRLLTLAEQIVFAGGYACGCRFSVKVKPHEAPGYSRSPRDDGARPDGPGASARPADTTTAPTAAPNAAWAATAATYPTRVCSWRVAAR